MEKLLRNLAAMLVFLLSTTVLFAQPDRDEEFPEHIAFAEHESFLNPDELEANEIDILFETGIQKEANAPDRHRDSLKEKLNLTDEQKNKINSLRTEHQKKMIDLKADLQKEKLDAKELRNSENLNRSQVISSVEKINKIKNEIALAAANHRMDVYEQLTPDQRKVWKDIRDDHPFKEKRHKKRFLEHEKK